MSKSYGGKVDTITNPAERINKVVADDFNDIASDIERLESTIDEIGLDFEDGGSDFTYTRTGALSSFDPSDTIPDSLLPIQSNMRRCTLNDDGSVNYYLNKWDSDYKEDGTTASDLTGADGNVMVEIPELWYKYWIESGTPDVYKIRISVTEKDGYTHSPKRYVGAYNAYVNGTVLESRSGVNCTTDLTISEYRTKAEAIGSGWHLFDHETWKVVSMLYLTEYANFNSQAKIGEGNTEYSSFTKNINGLSDYLGNQTGNVSTAGGDAGDFMSYRGIENLYGNVWQFLDGCAVRNDGTSKLYLCTDPSKYHSYAEDNVEDVAAGYNYAGNLLEADGYGKLPLLGSFLPVSSQGSSSAYMSDYYYTNFDSDSDSGWRVVLVGGASAGGSKAGVFCGASSYGFSYYHPSLGARLCFE